MAAQIYWQTMRVFMDDLPAILIAFQEGEAICNKYKRDNPRSDPYMVCEPWRKQYVVKCMSNKFEFARFTVPGSGLTRRSNEYGE